MRGRTNLRVLVLTAALAGTLLGAGQAGADRGRSRDSQQTSSQQTSPPETPRQQPSWQQSEQTSWQQTSPQQTSSQQTSSQQTSTQQSEADRGHARNSQQSSSQQTPSTTGYPASVGASGSAQGVVQAVSSSTVLVRQLDGSAVGVPVDRRTQVFVNGRPAQWSDVKPGFVLIASWQAGHPATVLRFLRPS